jgi:hypothetical protein
MAQPNTLTVLYRLTGSETVHWTIAPLLASVQHMSVYHGCLHIPMSEEFLNRADVIAIFQQVRGKRMPQRVAVDRLGQPYGSRGLFDGSLQHRFVQMMPPVLTGPWVQADL